MASDDPGVRFRRVRRRRLALRITFGTLGVLGALALASVELGAPGTALAIAAIVLGVFYVLDIEWIYDAPRPRIEVSEAARRLHREAVVIDLHCDCMLWDRVLRRRNRHGHVDLPRLGEGGVDGLAVTLPTTFVEVFNAVHRAWPLACLWSAWARLTHQVDAVAGQLEPASLRLARTAAELRRNRAEGAVSVFHGIEGAGALDGDLDHLDEAVRRGVLFCAPTHFFDNDYGGHGGGDGRGLSPLGRRLIERMNALGLLLDVAHASAATLREAVALSAFPPINSHTGARAVTDHWRNSSDEELCEVARAGGVVGIMFGGMGFERTSPEEVLEHVAHAVEVVGEDHVALGSDWDGCIRAAVDAASLPQLTELMLRRGWSEARIRKILGENFLRVWEARDRILEERRG